MFHNSMGIVNNNIIVFILVWRFLEWKLSISLILGSFVGFVLEVEDVVPIFGVPILAVVAVSWSFYLISEVNSDPRASSVIRVASPV